MEGIKLLDEYGISDFYIFKFGIREYNQDILNGKLYLNTVDFFRELEEEQKHAKGVADQHDSCLLTQNGRLEIQDKSDNAIVGTIDFNSSILKLCGDKLLFCLYLMVRNNVTSAYIGDNGNSLCVEAGFSEQQRKDIKEHSPLADSALLIPTTSNLIRNIRKAALSNGSKVKLGKVKYGTHVLTPALMDFIIDDMERVAFYKHTFFSPQQEYRMLFDPMLLRNGHFLDFEKPDDSLHLFDIDKALNMRFVFKRPILR